MEVFLKLVSPVAEKLFVNLELLNFRGCAIAKGLRVGCNPPFCLLRRFLSFSSLYSISMAVARLKSFLLVLAV
jgi:hypothetical protein